MGDMSPGVRKLHLSAQGDSTLGLLGYLGPGKLNSINNRAQLLVCERASDDGSIDLSDVHLELLCVFVAIVYYSTDRRQKLFFGGRAMRFEQKSTKNSDAPGLQPGNFFNASEGINQATVPQHVYWPTQQEAEKDEEDNSSNNSNQCIHNLFL